MFGLSTSAPSASELLNILLRYLAIQYNHPSTLATTSPIEQHCNSLDIMLPSFTSCCTPSLTNIMQFDLTTPTELPPDPTKGRNGLDSSLIVSVKRLWMNVISSAQAFIYKQILYKAIHTLKVHIFTRMNLNLDLKR